MVTVSPEATAASRDAVERERRAAGERLAELRRSFDDIAASVDAANTDDEHDPEGATLAFERAQVVSLLADTQHQLDALDDAGRRLDAGVYGTCERCGQPIGAERLAARPETTRCVRCASVGPRRSGAR